MEQNEQNNAPVPEAPKKHHIPTIDWLTPVVLLAILLGIVGFVCLGHRSLAKVYVGNIVVSDGQNEADLQDKIAAAAQQYRLELQYPDKQVKGFALKSAGITVDQNASAAKAHAVFTGNLLNRLTWWRPIRVPLDTKVNNVINQSFITLNATVANTPAKDATVVIDNGQVSITPASSGKGSTVKNARTAIVTSANSLSSTPLKLVPATLQPSIVASDLTKSKQKAEAIEAQKISFTIVGRTISPSPADIGKWLDINPVPGAKTVDVTVNSGKVSSYIDSVASPYVRPARNGLRIQLGDTYETVDYGVAGYDVVDKDKIAADLAHQLLVAGDKSIALALGRVDATVVDSKPYPKWFLADVTKKVMYAYEENTLVKTFDVSAGAPATPTVLGQYKIYAKYKSQDMSGNNADGSRYFQPAVPYVNYFYGGYAIHGNYWRPLSWFGNINSSHGCIGVSVDDGKWIYDWAPIGTPVIVHS